jgi:lysophospholipase L1-like esterase
MITAIRNSQFNTKQPPRRQDAKVKSNQGQSWTSFFRIQNSEFRISLASWRLGGSILIFFWLICAAIVVGAATTEPTDFKFQFGANAAQIGFTHVGPGDAYSKAAGFGWEPGSKVAELASCATGDQPIFFSVAVPEGNYRVTVQLGDATGESTTTVKAELRRLMLERIHAGAGEVVTRTFTVNVRRPEISTGGMVRRKAPRETIREAWAWDDKLTLEFTDSRPCVRSIEIESAPDLPTIFICGDSTSTDQASEPFNSWGQMLTRFFTPHVVVANNGESGETTSSFIGERRWAKVMSVIRKGDFVLIQFAHNDEKDRGPNAGAYKNFTQNLTRFVNDSRAHGAAPILITPMHRREFDAAGRVVNTHGDYPDAVRKVAADMNVPLIDLANMSATLYEALGPKNSGLLFAGKDTTHHDNYGSYEFAKCLVLGIRQGNMELAKYLTTDVPPFDPGHPDAFADFKIQAEPMTGPTTRPAGS